MNTLQVKENLMKAFEANTSEELKRYLPKTDFDDKASMLHAAAVIDSYNQFYGVRNKNLIYEIIDSESNESQRRLAIDAKHGYGYYDYCVTHDLEINSKESYIFHGYC